MKGIYEEIKKHRKTEHDINPIILNRWTSRAMSGESLSDTEIMPLFEAARWAPSGMNNQLWRFVYAKRDTEYFNEFFDLLMDGNKVWCKNASVLIILISRRNSYNDNRPQSSHSMEAGAAFQNLSIEGTSRNLIVNCLGGFDYAKAHKFLKLTDVWNVECMIAVGKKGTKESLPEKLQQREIPSSRKPLSELVFEGRFKAD